MTVQLGGNLGNNPETGEIDPHGAIERAEWMIPLAQSLDTEDLAELVNAIAFAKEKLARVNKAVEAALIDRIKEHGEFVIGSVRYYVGTPKDTKCIDVGKALHAIIEAVGGDFDELPKYLSSDAIKHGACKSLLTVEAYNAHFVTTAREELKEGSPKRLYKFDENFAPRKLPAATTERDVDNGIRQGS